MAKPSAIKPLSQDAKIFHLIYGFPNSGKTSYIAAAAAEGKKILLIKSPLDHIPARALSSGMEQWVVQTWDDMDEVLQYGRHDGGDWDWFAWDSISLTQDQTLQAIWDDLIIAKPHRAKYRVDKGEYGVNMWRIEQWVRHMVGAQSVNLLISAHPFETQNPFNEQGGMIYMPWVQGNQMAEKICAEMTFIGYLEAKEGKNGRFRRLHTQLTEYVYAKDQYDAFPEGRVDNPTLLTVEEAINAAKKGPKAKRGATRGQRRGAGRAQPAGRRSR